MADLDGEDAAGREHEAANRILPLDEDIPGLVAYIKSPESVWFTPHVWGPGLEAVMERLESLEEKDCVVAAETTEQNRYMCRFSEDGLLYRCCILRREDPERCVVRFVDYGNEELKLLQELFQLPNEQLRQLPNFAYEVKIVGAIADVNDADLDIMKTVLIDEGDLNLRLSEHHMGTFYRNEGLLSLPCGQEPLPRLPDTVEPVANMPPTDADLGSVSSSSAKVEDIQLKQPSKPTPEELKAGALVTDLDSPGPELTAHADMPGVDETSKSTAAVNGGKEPNAGKNKFFSGARVPVQVVFVESVSKVWVHLEPALVLEMSAILKKESEKATLVPVIQPAKDQLCMARYTVSRGKIRIFLYATSPLIVSFIFLSFYFLFLSINHICHIPPPLTK
jgi:hypothetical protein